MQLYSEERIRILWNPLNEGQTGFFSITLLLGRYQKINQQLDVSKGKRNQYRIVKHTDIHTTLIIMRTNLNYPIKACETEHNHM